MVGARHVCKPRKRRDKTKGTDNARSLHEHFKTRCSKNFIFSEASSKSVLLTTIEFFSSRLVVFRTDFHNVPKPPESQKPKPRPKIVPVTKGVGPKYPWRNGRVVPLLPHAPFSTMGWRGRTRKVVGENPCHQTSRSLKISRFRSFLHRLELTKHGVSSSTRSCQLLLSYYWIKVTLFGSVWTKISKLVVL